MERKALYALVLCALIAGTNGVMIKYMDSMTPGSIAWFRAAIPAALLITWFSHKKMPFFRGNYKKMIFTSVINAGRMYLYLIAFIFTSIGNAVILFYSWPIFVSILGVLFLKERLSFHQTLLLLMAFAGLILAYSHKQFTFQDDDFIGMLAAVLAALGYAITVILFKSESHNYEKEELIFYQNFASVLLFLPFLVLNFPEAEWPHLSLAVGYAFLIGIVVFGLFFYALKHLDASTASSMMYLEVISAVILGVFLLKERFHPNMIYGGVLILLSSFLLTQSKRKA